MTLRNLVAEVGFLYSVHKVKSSILALCKVSWMDHLVD